MAIIIPSKNIYEINNPKIRDNVIDKVSVEQTIVTPNNEYEVSVYNENILATNDKKEEKSTTQITSAPIDQNIWSILGVGAKTNYEITDIEKIKIPKIDKNKFISKVFDKTNNNDEANIKISMRVTRRITVAEVSRSLKLDSFSSGNFYFSNFENLDSNDIISINTSEGNIGLSGINVKVIAKNENPLPPTWVETIEFNDNKFSENVNAEYFYIKGLTSSLIKNVNITLNNLETNLKELVIDSESDKDNYLLNNLSVVTKSTSYFVASAIYFEGTSADLSNYTFPCRLIKIEQIASSFEITLSGNTIGINLTDGSITYGSGNKPYSLSGNELLQDSALANGNVLTEHLANNVLNKYTKGIETATLLCDISNYYTDTNDLFVSETPTIETGGKVSKIVAGINTKENYSIVTVYSATKRKIKVKILCNFTDGSLDTKTLDIEPLSNTQITIQGKILSKAPTTSLVHTYIPMSFRLHDEVIPMIYGANGQDNPMSKYSDGTPKVFEVVESNIIYDGAVWQELTLREIPNTNTTAQVMTLKNNLDEFIIIS